MRSKNFVLFVKVNRYGSILYCLLRASSQILFLWLKNKQSAYHDIKHCAVLFARNFNTYFGQPQNVLLTLQWCDGSFMLIQPSYIHLAFRLNWLHYLRSQLFEAQEKRETLYFCWRKSILYPESSQAFHDPVSDNHTSAISIPSLLETKLHLKIFKNAVHT
jgi:hypothetical protein